MPLKKQVSVLETTGKQEANQRQLILFYTSFFRSEDKMAVRVGIGGWLPKWS